LSEITRKGGQNSPFGGQIGQNTWTC